MKSVLSIIGGILLFVIVFWLIGVVTTTPSPTGATAVGDGIKATITFIADVAKAI